MSEISLAVRAMSACDRLEQSIKDGDKEAIEAVRALIARWVGKDFESVKGTFALAFRTMMQNCVDGGPHELAIAMMAIRSLTEHQLALAFGNEYNGEDQDPES